MKSPALPRFVVAPTGSGFYVVVDTAGRLKESRPVPKRKARIAVEVLNSMA